MLAVPHNIGTLQNFGIFEGTLRSLRSSGYGKLFFLSSSPSFARASLVMLLHHWLPLDDAQSKRFLRQKVCTRQVKSSSMPRCQVATMIDVMKLNSKAQSMRKSPSDDRRPSPSPTMKARWHGGCPIVDFLGNMRQDLRKILIVRLSSVS